MDTRRTTLIATIVVIALLAVGIGYAYTAITANSGNNSENEYVKLTQSGTGSYRFTTDNETVYFDTVNQSGNRGETSDVYKYYLSDNSTIFGIGGTNYQLVKVGDSFNLDASQVNYTVESALPITFTSSGINATGDWLVLMKVDISAGDAAAASTVWKIYEDGVWNDNSFVMNYHINNTVIEYKSVTITIYYGYKADIHAVGSDDAPAAKPFENASIQFKATVNEHNTAPAYCTITATAETDVDLTVSPVGKYGEGAKITFTVETGKVFTTVKIGTSDATQITGSTYNYTVTAADVTAGTISFVFTTTNA